MPNQTLTRGKAKKKKMTPNQSGQLRTISAKTPEIFCFGISSDTRNITETYLLIFWSLSTISVCFGLMNNLI